jgi:hypothetical protein
MVDFGVKQGCPLPPTLFSLYIDEFDTYLDKINEDSLCLFKMIIAILLYADDVVMIFKSKACLQRLLNYTSYTSYTSFALLLALM